MGTFCLEKRAGGQVRVQEVVEMETGRRVGRRRERYREPIDLIRKKGKRSHYMKYECSLQKELCAAIIHNNEGDGIFLFTQAQALHSQCQNQGIKNFKKIPSANHHTIGFQKLIMPRGKAFPRISQNTLTKPFSGK